ncbi:hypothetical protein ADIARSV_1220 [Arcticibacter svalbardensis MN12-7]|uniref:HTH cro/C1-type domain-containing protein n=1 Tax=Arcticibacter svalbardensis MN12-7 TaxID=1150600 RepID=R9H353_9SPHI|nr:helix-turn-helix transcriptional regulator [Arcticibacter svalbardensis]EOR95614.1 hypothetical protein ADIARSV_1220 [Arcticibacter svalbardensis MN12-7]
MSKRKSRVLDLELLGENAINLPADVKGISLTEYKNKRLGIIGTKKRDEYEFELRIEMLQEAIRDIRKRQNLSQEELGKLIGVNKAQISKIEKGNSNPTFSLLVRVFDALGAKVKFSIELDNEKLQLI